MPPRISRRLAVAAITAIGLLAASPASRSQTPRSPHPRPVRPPPGLGAERRPARSRTRSRPTSSRPVMEAHFQGLGPMEQYEYQDAVEAFRDGARAGPGLDSRLDQPGDRALNDSGVKAEEAKKAGGGADRRPAISTRRSNSWPASWSETRTTRTLISAAASSSSSRASFAEAHAHFKRVTEIDPNDATAWYWLAQHRDGPRECRISRRADKLAKQQIALLNKALELQPVPDARRSTSSRMAYRLRQRAARRADELLDRWKKINPIATGPSPGPGDIADQGVRRDGPVRDGHRPVPSTSRSARTPAARAEFRGRPAAAGQARRRRALGQAVRLHRADRGDRPGPRPLRRGGRRVRRRRRRPARPLPGLGGRRAEGNSRRLALEPGRRPLRGCLGAFGLPEDRASLGVAAADFDADRHIDLFLTGVGDNRLLRNRDGKTFEDISCVARSRSDRPPSRSRPAGSTSTRTATSTSTS